MASAAASTVFTTSKSILLHSNTIIESIENNTALVQLSSNNFGPATSSKALISRIHKPFNSAPSLVDSKRPVATNMCICSYNKKRILPWKKYTQLLAVEKKQSLIKKRHTKEPKSKRRLHHKDSESKIAFSLMTMVQYSN